MFASQQCLINLILFYSEHYDTYCLRNYGNGYCDNGCNNEECNWDGLDCEPDPPVLAAGSLVLVVLMEPEVILYTYLIFDHYLNLTLIPFV